MKATSLWRQEPATSKECLLNSKLNLKRASNWTSKWKMRRNSFRKDTLNINKNWLKKFRDWKNYSSKLQKRSSNLTLSIVCSISRSESTRREKVLFSVSSRKAVPSGKIVRKPLLSRKRIELDLTWKIWNHPRKRHQPMPATLLIDQISENQGSWNPPSLMMPIKCISLFIQAKKSLWHYQTWWRSGRDLLLLEKRAAKSWKCPAKEQT